MLLSFLSQDFFLIVIKPNQVQDGGGEQAISPLPRDEPQQHKWGVDDIQTLSDESAPGIGFEHDIP